MKRVLSLVAVGVALLGSAVTASAQYGYGTTPYGVGQNGYYPEPPALARPNGYVYDSARGWEPRPSFFGGYNTGSFQGRYGFYRRATPNLQFNRGYTPRYGGFGPGIGEYRQFGGGDFYAK